VEGLVC